MTFFFNIPWNSCISLFVTDALGGAISSLDRRPFLSILISRANGSKAPSLLRPSPSPGCQPIFCKSRIPTPPATGAALLNWSFLTQACKERFRTHQPRNQTRFSLSQPGDFYQELVVLLLPNRLTYINNNKLQGGHRNQSFSALIPTLTNIIPKLLASH